MTEHFGNNVNEARELDSITAHEQHLANLDAKINLQSQAIAASMSPRVPASPTSPLMPTPENFSGDAFQSKGFVMQCFFYFASHKGMPELQKISVNLLTGKVLKWEQGDELTSSYE